MDDSTLLKKAEAHVTALFEKFPHEKLVYHNLEHTQKVVSRVKEIAGHYNLIDNDMQAVLLAAWFHDTGYLIADPAVHEEKSVELMKDFMNNANDEQLVKGTEGCIMATKQSVKPANLLQEIMADADTYNLATKEFSTTNKQVYKEFILRHGYLSRHDWDKQTIRLLENHHYYTAYCKDLLTHDKKKNLKKIKKHFEEKKNDEPLQAPEKLKDDPKPNNLTTKGIQTMLRLTSENHMRLSDMADGKANILISVNSIIISVILSVLLRRLQVDTYLTIPTIIFLASSVCTIVISILATRPKISQGTFSDQDITDKKTNLLFFGNFYKTSQEDYERAMSHMMVDSEYLYGSLVKDIYQLGVVLARKYRLIRFAYNVFMFGIIISVLAFAIAAIISHGADGVVTNAQGAPL